MGVYLFGIGTEECQRLKLMFHVAVTVPIIIKKDQYNGFGFQ